MPPNLSEILARMINPKPKDKPDSTYSLPINPDSHYYTGTGDEKRIIEPKYEKDDRSS